MALSPALAVDRTLENSASDPVEDRPTDGHLVREYLDTRSEAAFTAIVNRFSPLVMSVARRSIHNRSLAEDVFQATFLLLVKNIDRIRSPEAIAAWLHGTALRVSKRALATEKRQMVSIDTAQPISTTGSVLSDIAQRHELQVLDEELQRMPETYRSVLVLHYLDGMTCEETAASLCTTTGSIRGRLQRGSRELKRRLLRRGVRASIVFAGIVLSRSSAEAAVTPTLIASTAQGSLLASAGSPTCLSSTALQFAAQESTSMITAKSLAMTSISLTIVGSMCYGLAAVGEASASPTPLSPRITTLATAPVRIDNPPTIDLEQPTLLALADTKESKPNRRPTLSLKYGDGKPDGKKSIAGSGEMIQFTLPNTSQKLRSVRIHCARYGTAKAPDEDIEVTVSSEDGSDIIHTELVPYSKFQRGESRWTTIAFEDPVDVPETFWVTFMFNAARTKGVYVSYDSSTDGSRSQIGLPGATSKAVNFEGDWMVQAILTKPE